MKEIWKPIKGFKGWYSVSNKGRVQRTRKDKYFDKNRFFVMGLNSCGYPIVGLTKNRIKKTKAVHRLVAREFIGKRPKGKEVNHKDCNKLNNHIDNLEYVSRKQNMRHASDNGLFGKHKRKKPTAKL